MCIQTILTVILCGVFDLRVGGNAFYNTVGFLNLLLAYLILGWQMISFCIMNAQLFDSQVRAVIAFGITYYGAESLFNLAVLWPTGIQYLLIFLCPFIAGRSISQVQSTQSCSFSNKCLSPFV